LTHGIDGDYERAMFELGKALSPEPYQDARRRIAEAITLAEAGRQRASTRNLRPPPPPSLLKALPDDVLPIMELIEGSESWSGG
jgi:predicted transcriptional regulator